MGAKFKRVDEKAAFPSNLLHGHFVSAGRGGAYHKPSMQLELPSFSSAKLPGTDTPHGRTEKGTQLCKGVCKVLPCLILLVTSVEFLEPDLLMSVHSPWLC